jgi:hypothetical protein
VHRLELGDGQARYLPAHASDPERHYLGVEVAARPLVLHGACADCQRSTEERTARTVSRGRFAPERGLVLVLAGATGAVQHDLVVVGAELQAARETLDRPLQITIVKGHHPPTRVTQQVMMMLAPRIDQLIARRAITQL